MTDSIAIIGAGVSGLSAAFELIDREVDARITVFERGRTLGGNADTVRVDLGADHRDGGRHVRYADLGVNDINYSAYVKLAAAMETTGYHVPGEVETNLLPLEDTACFFTPDGREVWTMDGGEAVPERILDMRFSLGNGEHEELHRSETAFMQYAANFYGPETPDDARSDLWNATTAEFVAHYREEELDETARPVFDRVVRLFLLPRIAAMYFADEAGPEGMPFRGVMNYYRLQEGYGTGKDPDRRYFRRGSNDWIGHLAHWLTQRGATIRGRYDARVRPAQGRIEVYPAGRPDEAELFDKVIMAGHADDQLLAIQEGDAPLLSADAAGMLGRVRHSVSRAVAHTWTAVLPPEMGAWRTYNVAIREGAGLRPYQMSYVQNFHRNDIADPERARADLPRYFVTLNPDPPIPERHILPLDGNGRVEAVLTPPNFEPPAHDDGLAVQWFRHVVMTPELMRLQDGLHAHQGQGGGRLYFAGCWTRGAGLHEQCFEQAERVVDAIVGGSG